MSCMSLDTCEWILSQTNELKNSHETPNDGTLNLFCSSMHEYRHLWMDPDTDERVGSLSWPWHTRWQCILAAVCMSCMNLDIYEWVMSQMDTSCYRHDRLNSCLMCEWVMSHVWMRQLGRCRVTRLGGTGLSVHTGRIDGNDRNPSRLRMEKSHLKRHELSFSWIFIV